MSRIVAGMQPVREAIRAHPDRVRKVLILDHPPSQAQALQALARFAADHRVGIESVHRSALDRLTKNTLHQGVVAIADDLPIVDVTEISRARPSLVLLLDRVCDPQNFGAIIRSAVAFGAEAVVWPEHASAPLSPATVRASAGAIEHARLCRTRSLSAALLHLKEAGLTAVALVNDAPATLAQTDLTAPIALVVGSEGSGIRKPIRKACDLTARLPSRQPIPILNASVAAAIALYEVRRQRDLARPTPQNATI